MTAIAQKRQRLNLLLLTEDNQRETSLLEALQESRTRCRLLCAPLGKDTIQYLERKGQYEGAPKADLVFFDGRRAGGEALSLLRKLSGAVRWTPYPSFYWSMMRRSHCWRMWTPDRHGPQRSRPSISWISSRH